jgi:hypothetical protein
VFIEIRCNKAMGDIARECVEKRYSVEVVSRQYLDVFKKLVS